MKTKLTIEIELTLAPGTSSPEVAKITQALAYNEDKLREFFADFTEDGDAISNAKVEALLDADGEWEDGNTEEVWAS